VRRVDTASNSGMLRDAREQLRLNIFLFSDEVHEKSVLGKGGKCWSGDVFCGFA
jgi:hypothetical protein